LLVDTKSFNCSDCIMLYNMFWGKLDLSGIFGTGAVLQTDLNLILQVAAFISVLIGFVYKQRAKFKMHGKIMGVAVTLHIISFLLAMGPSFILAYEYFTTATSECGVQTTWIHAIPGAVAMVIGAYLIVAWAVRPVNIAACARRKRLMDVTVVLWLISLIFGIAVYIAFYV